jgi:hypothetical protein
MTKTVKLIKRQIQDSQAHWKKYFGVKENLAIEYNRLPGVLRDTPGSLLYILRKYLKTFSCL